jgi:ABC-type phosphate/phosphonate transport system substrate-binding protein
MIAALPMYDFPWVRAAHDRLWAHVRDRLRAQGIAAPDALDRTRDLHEGWADPGLILGQTCGYPFWKGLRRQVELLATPVYSFPGCEGASHRSFLIAHADDTRETLAEFRNTRAAANSGDSNTGVNLFRAAVAPLADGQPFFLDIIETGAHGASVSAIVDGRADIAAIDCVTYALLARGASGLMARVKVIGETQPTPGLPFIANRALPSATRAAVREALRALPPIPELGLTAVAFLPETAYAVIGEIEAGAVEAGYPRLA